MTRRAAIEGKWKAAERALPKTPAPRGHAGIGQRLLMARVRARMSQRELGRKIDISTQTIIRWERGLCWPDVRDLDRIAAALGIPAVILTGWSEAANWVPQEGGGYWLGCPQCKPELGQIRLPYGVKGDGPFASTYAPPSLYVASFNPQGAAGVRAENGRMLGIKPSEFIWLYPVPPYDRWCQGAGGIHR